MFIQFGARLLGIVYIVFGIVGFLPFDSINPIHHEGVGARYLFNLVAINAVHNVVHLALGVTGVWAATTLSRSRRWAMISGSVLVVLFIAGMLQAFSEGLPKDQLLLGIVPLNSPGHILHLVTGGIALYLGLVTPESQ